MSIFRTRKRNHAVSEVFEVSPPILDASQDVNIARYGGVTLLESAVEPIGFITEQEVDAYNADSLKRALEQAKGYICVRPSLIPGQFEIVPVD